MSTRNKITFIGGGSYQWVPVLFRDIAVNPALQDSQFVLHDIDPARNEELAGVCRILSRRLGSGVTVATENDLERALADATAVILCISTGALDAMEHDIEIPKKYGIYQPVGDSTGPGGISRTLRNVPVVTALIEKMERICPAAWLLNLSNPMNQIVRTVQQTSSIKVIGLCHEFNSFMTTVENLLGLDSWKREASAVIGGINHFAWVTALTVGGVDKIEALRQCRQHDHRSAVGQDVHPSHSLAGNQVKFQLLDTYGVIPYPGDRHLVEFFPYFLSAKTEYGAAFGVELTSIDDRRHKWRGYFTQRIEEWTADRPDSVPAKPSDESLAPILAALIGGGPPTIQPATLSNRGQVEGLPHGTSVETLVTFNNGSVHPHASGALPPAVHSLVARHAANQDLTVEAALEGSREKALQAMLADPLNNSNDVREISMLLDELLKANAALLPQFFPRRASSRNGHASLLQTA